MHFTDTGIILSVRKLDEHGGIVRVFTEHHGLHAGVDRYAFSSKRRGIYQPGNRVHVSWRARLCEQMGSFTTELLASDAAHILGSRLKLALLQSACQLVESILNEREPQDEVWEVFEGLMRGMSDGECQRSNVEDLDIRHSTFDILLSYVLLELTLLKTAGFGLDLSCCAATGTAQNLAYVSPKSGRAVSEGAGAAYREKLFRLPEFLLNPLSSADLLPHWGRTEVGVEVKHGAKRDPRPSPPPTGEGISSAPALRGINMADLLDALRVSGYFLETRVLAAKQGKLPHAREQIVKMMEKTSRLEPVAISREVA